MASILTKAGCFVAIILLGWTLRRFGFFKEDDFQLLAKIVLKITLPASIVYSLSGKTIDASLLMISLIGLLLGFVYMGAGFLLEAGKGKSKQAFTLLNISGYNIGNFSMPFVQGFLGPTGVIATSLFDTGNAFICLGTAYSVAATIRRGEKLSLLRILKALFRSVPFLTYIVMTTLSLLRLRLPQPVTDFAGIIGSANPFLAMLMIGVGFRLSGDRTQLSSIIRILAVRYGLALIFAFGCFLLLPFDYETRLALTVLVFSPIASAAPPFTEAIGEDFGLSSAINSFSIIISLVCIILVLILLA